MLKGSIGELAGKWLKATKMTDEKTEAIWSWNYNHGKAYPMPCKKCGALVEMEKIGYRNRMMHVRCPECGYEEQRSD